MMCRRGLLPLLVDTFSLSVPTQSAFQSRTERQRENSRKKSTHIQLTNSSTKKQSSRDGLRQQRTGKKQIFFFVFLAPKFLEIQVKPSKKGKKKGKEEGAEEAAEEEAVPAPEVEVGEDGVSRPLPPCPSSCPSWKASPEFPKI